MSSGRWDISCSLSTAVWRCSFSSWLKLNCPLTWSHLKLLVFVSCPTSSEFSLCGPDTDIELKWSSSTLQIYFYGLLTLNIFCFLRFWSFYCQVFWWQYTCSFCVYRPSWFCCTDQYSTAQYRLGLSHLNSPAQNCTTTTYSLHIGKTSNMKLHAITDYIMSACLHDRGYRGLSGDVRLCRELQAQSDSAGPLTCSLKMESQQINNHFKLGKWNIFVNLFYT